MKLMTHVVVGYPSLAKTESLVKIMAEEGVDFIELQIPFSDPLADGPTIMRACEKALENGVKVKDAFELAGRLSKEITPPLLFMAYYNTVFKYGTKKFCNDASKAGIWGLIVPDIPPEEEDEEQFINSCKQAGLKNIRVVSPVSTKERLLKNARIGDGFVYCTARQGITGVRKDLAPDLVSFLKKVKSVFKIPIAVGFGISSKVHIDKLAPHADIAVVGSAILDIFNKSESSSLDSNIKAFLDFLK